MCLALRTAFLLLTKEQWRKGTQVGSWVHCRFQLGKNRDKRFFEDW
ncbi:rCG62741 [Rattus norvegicus]|uniref:RCG62741 n=1 Tax=Rattus norvegicus TaxID=10116 RepID=A6J5R3_RAT|nr:rCG62741 [Rattus norvegicus]